ncbi:hypothetical protein GOP47_0000720 [Adiantum capillus-veneris]|uniref:PDZ domain-containing protein n=1 Tax=Adiantum capillus-veneris TaxID=13818 RepID=A0A9D4ZSK0_ADICA|nr:hypothetical protein GOP47_0000720 [Adiantum capillus-veneris]
MAAAATTAACSTTPPSSSLNSCGLYTLSVHPRSCQGRHFRPPINRNRSYCGPNKHHEHLEARMDHPQHPSLRTRALREPIHGNFLTSQRTDTSCIAQHSRVQHRGSTICCRSSGCARSNYYNPRVWTLFCSVLSKHTHFKVCNWIWANSVQTARLIVISAGVIANLTFAYFILFGQVLTSGLLQQEIFPGAMVPEVISTSVAAKSGIQAGDVILGVNGEALPAGEKAVFDLVHIIKASPNGPLSFYISRKQEPLEIKVTPDKSIDGSGRIGVQLAPNARPVKVKAKDLAEATVRASKEFRRLFVIVTDGLKQVILNFSQTADKISGPVAIVAVGAEVARTDVAGLSQFAAIVNINLAVVNILPLPALDGGYILLILLEALRGGKKLPDKVEQSIMSSGIVLLLAIGVFLMVRDALNLGLAELL